MMKLISTLLVALLFVSTANAALRGEKKSLLEVETVRELMGMGMGMGDMDGSMDGSRDRSRDRSMDGMSSGRQLMGMGFGWMGMGGGPMDGTMNGPMNGPMDGPMDGTMDGTMLGWYCCHPKSEEDCEDDSITPEGCITEEEVHCEWLDDGRCRMIFNI